MITARKQGAVVTKTSNSVLGNKRKSAPTSTVLSYDQRLERFDKRQTRIRIGIMFVLFGTAGFIFWRNSDYQPPTPEPNFSGYYEGPWVNKNGDLVSPEGVVLKQGYGVPATGPSGSPKQDRLPHTQNGTVRASPAQARRIVQNPFPSPRRTLEP